MAATELTTSNDEYDVLGGYIPAFVQHLQDTRARLGIRVGSQATDTQVSDWTPAERDAFFRALSVFSRWRPDLIAACVSTRSEWEVWMYLDALEAGAAELAVQRDEDDANSAMDVGADSDVGSGADTDDDACEPAVEVSQAWIDVEEQMASWILEEERRVAIEGDAVADVEDVRPKRKRGRLRGAGKGRRRARTVAEEDRSSPEVSPRESSREPSDSEDKRKALMGRLEVPHLLVLDSMLREAEEANKESRESSVTTTQHGDEGEPNVRDVDTSAQIIAPRGASDISNMMIDPVLLALSGDVNPMEQESSTRAPTQAQSLLGAHEVLLQTPGDTTRIANVEPDLSLFSPRSRRRIQKRLYMRRKRASSEGVVNTGIAKLRPGKKSKIKTPAMSTGPSLDAEMDATEDMRKKSKGGLTLPYKLKAQFAELGIDGAYLRNREMDLLHLGVLGRLMGSADAGQSVDAELIRHLQAAVVLFVTDITHRAIVWREREIKLKQRSQGWKQGDHITVAAIEHAVSTADHSHKERFESPNPPSIDGDGEAADLPSELPRFSPHRDVYTPLIRPPSEWRIDPLGCLSRTYEREATRTRRGPSAELEDELMSDETDEEALAAELAEDAAEDERDTALGAAAEEALFEGVRRKQ